VDEVVRIWLSRFDIVYEDVTVTIKNTKHFVPTVSIIKSWLQTLILEFKDEENRWSGSQYDGYWVLCKEKFGRNPVLQLSGMVFLHISYDLPRVIAKNWPSTTWEDEGVMWTPIVRQPEPFSKV